MPELDVTQYVVLLATIVGVTELITRLRAKDYWVALTIGCAAVIGSIFGAIHYYTGVGPVEGVALGFSASGVLATLGMIGNKSSAAPSDATLTKGK